MTDQWVVAPITTVSEFLDATADRIEKRGWTAKRWRTPSGAVCLVQAMDEVAAIHRCHVTYSDASRRLIDSLRALPMAWNDAPGRTKQEVLDMLREQAKAARVEEESRGR